MNKALRKQLTTILDEIIVLGKQLEPIVSDLARLGTTLEEIRDEQQEIYDSLSEKAQESEKGQERQAFLDQLSEACTALDNLVSGIDSDAIDEAVTALDDARGTED